MATDNAQPAALESKPQSIGEQGFMLLGLIVAIFLMLLVLSAAAPPMVRNLRRERDVEAVHRGNQYVRAIREFYIKNGQHYPGSMEQLDKTNNVRFLRQRYKSPIDGKDWRTIPVGQNKTTVKGFFGQPLAGLATTGLGSAAGMASPSIGQTPGSSTGAGGSTGATGSTGTTGTTGSSLPGLFGVGSNASGTSMFGGGSSGPFMGVGLSSTGSSIVEVNEQATYDTWEFLYDPRIELLKAKAAAGAAVGSIGAGSLGQTPGSIGNPTVPNPGFGNPPAPPAPPLTGAPNLP